MLGDGTDIAKVALVNGGAVVAPDAPNSYRVQQMEALNNHRGIWLNPPPNLLVAGAPAVDAPTHVLVAGDDGSDGITYVGGVPEVVIDGEAVFLIYGGDVGWGYYDHWHHWHDAPGRYRAHMERFHPGGHGLRGYRDEAALHREVAGAGAHSGELHTAGFAGHPGGATAAHPTVLGSAHPAVAGGAHPGVAGGAHPAVAGGGHSLLAPGAHPAGTGGGFVHPGASAAGFHPGGGAAPAVHASAGSGTIKKK